MDQPFAVAHPWQRILELHSDEEAEIDHFLDNALVNLADFEDFMHLFLGSKLILAPTLFPRG